MFFSNALNQECLIWIDEQTIRLLMVCHLSHFLGSLPLLPVYNSPPTSAEAFLGKRRHASAETPLNLRDDIITGMPICTTFMENYLLSKL